jgi:hypothetical protein
VHGRVPRPRRWLATDKLHAPDQQALPVSDEGSHPSAAGGKCLRQHKGRARGARSKRPRIRQKSASGACRPIANSRVDAELLAGARSLPDPRRLSRLADRVLIARTATSVGPGGQAAAGRICPEWRRCGSLGWAQRPRMRPSASSTMTSSVAVKRPALAPSRWGVNDSDLFDEDPRFGVADRDRRAKARCPRARGRGCDDDS